LKKNKLYYIYMENKSGSRLRLKGGAVEFKDDDYETHSEILKDLLPFIKNGEKTKSSWFDTCFVCYGLELEKDIIKVGED